MIIKKETFLVSFFCGLKGSIVAIEIIEAIEGYRSYRTIGSYGDYRSYISYRIVGFRDFVL